MSGNNKIVSCPTCSEELVIKNNKDNKFELLKLKENSGNKLCPHCKTNNMKRTISWSCEKCKIKW